MTTPFDPRAEPPIDPAIAAAAREMRRTIPTGTREAYAAAAFDASPEVDEVLVRVAAQHTIVVHVTGRDRVLSDAAIAAVRDAVALRAPAFVEGRVDRSVRVAVRDGGIVDRDALAGLPLAGAFRVEQLARDLGSVTALFAGDGTLLATRAGATAAPAWDWTLPGGDA